MIVTLRLSVIETRIRGLSNSPLFLLFVFVNTLDSVLWVLNVKNARPRLKTPNYPNLQKSAFREVFRDYNQFIYKKIPEKKCGRPRN